jgi:hypothetical protein
MTDTPFQRLTRFIRDREGSFDEAAADLFRFQWERNPAYRALCQARGVGPDSLTDSRQIPAVATRFFKRTTLFAGLPGQAAASFSTSGTSGGPSNKGRSYFSAAGLDLMETGIVANARAMLFPDVERTHILVLAPSPQAAPEMIMAWGMDRLIRHFGTPESGFLVGPQGLDVPGLLGKLAEFTRQDAPVTLIGASFGFVNLLEGLAKKGFSIRLPKGSRTMDAGGYKGRSRVLTRAELQRWLSDVFGIHPGLMVNLLGMTELASQLYDDTIAATAAGKTPHGLKQNPHWTRTRVVDPATLADVPDGQEGVLLHLDLANLDTPMAVLTDDVGVMHARGFEVLGRVGADDSRGCSLTVDELTRGNA